MSGEITPEVQAVLDAALKLGEDFPWLGTPNPTDYGLCDAVAAYRKATAPPEPFEAYVCYGSMTPDIWWISRDHHKAQASNARVWRCTVTPVERVRP